VRVVNLDNGRSAIVKIVDRGPYIRGRIIDVSPAVAVTLGFREAGLAHVKIEPVSLEASGAERPGRQAASARYETSAYEICRYGAVRLDHLQGDSVDDERALSRNATGCENLRSRFFRLARSPDDAPPLLARIRIHLTGVEAAGSIPVSAFTEAEAAASIPVRAIAAIDAAASIPVSAVAAVPERGATARPVQPSASNPVVSFLARLRSFFP